MRKTTGKLEGTWRYVTLQVDGKALAKDAIAGANLTIEGDQFQVESPGESYAGRFTVDAQTTPHQIDIDFQDGPAAGLRRGIFELDGDHLTICLGLDGRDRPSEFATKRGSGHALERLERGAAAGRGPSRKAPASSGASTKGGATGSDPDFARTQGIWAMVSGDRDGKPLPASFVAGSRRIAQGDQTTVMMSGRVFLSAGVTLDSSKSPKEIDYLLANGKTQLGIYKLEGKTLIFCFGKPGAKRPTGFTSGSGHTLSTWKYEGEG